MEYKIFTPPLQLNELVQCFWALESDPSEVTPKEYFLMADNCVEIIFQYNEGFQKYSKQSARIRFQHSIHDKFDVGNEIGFFGVRLYPHAVSQLLNIPASDVSNRVFDFSDLFKEDGRNLSDQIYNSVNANQRVALVSDFLKKKASLYKIDPIRYFVTQIIEQEGWVDISNMQQESGLSVKQFERRFKAIAGFSPKYFARIARFQAVKNKYRSNRFQTLTSLAYSCNYYDQPHFNREFKEFSGVQPLRYFKLLNEESTDQSKFGNNCLVVNNQRHFDGYLPCGWFV